MDFEAIRELAKHHKQSFGRILKCEMYKLENGRLLTITRLHDDFHDMNLAILLSDDYRIEEIAGKMDRIPQPCCETKPLEMLSSLKGIHVLERGGAEKGEAADPAEHELHPHLRDARVHVPIHFRGELQHHRPEVGRGAHP